MHSVSLASHAWQFRDATKRSPWRDAVVPGCVHRDLLRHGLIPDPFWGTNEAGLQWIEERDWEYRTTFAATAEHRGGARVDLVADGLDTIATIRLNGRELGRAENMFAQHRWDVTRLLKREGNVLSIRFSSAMDYIRTHRRSHQPKEFNDPVGRCSVVRKQQCQFGWDWGPRFVTAGIWRDLRLESWSGNRLEAVRVTQTHRRDGTVTLALVAELLRPEPVTYRWRLRLADRVVAEGRGPTIRIREPQRWWPNGYGAQPLYDLDVEVSGADGLARGSWRRRLGLRTIALDRHADRWGESFQFVVNGRPIFAKGANWVPAHSFVAGLTRADYARDLGSAAAANMNMVRAWGGGVYESEDFYDLCDELGLLVWQDFMFACTLYPGDQAFVASVRAEADYQVRRLRHRACLALWCGNNEIEQLNEAALAQPKLRRSYDAVFHEALPAVVAAVDGTTPYWPSSQYRGDGDNSHAAGEKRGDTHYWDVWHARHPVKDYEKWRFRFISEFGMQSYSSPETNATFCPAGDDNVFGAPMENHQKNRAGNQIILDYVSQYYRFPRSQDALIYLSQLNQARCMQTGVEHWRRAMPRTMGTLYWQLNDCWPVASWSSIEFTGRWKALHHIARRFFAPALVTAEVEGAESLIIGNYRRSTVSRVHVYTVFDGPVDTRGVVRWDILHLDGRAIRSGQKRVNLRYGQSVRQHVIELGPAIAAHGVENLYVRIALEVGNRRVSEETVFLTAPRFMPLRKAPVHTAIAVAAGSAALTFTSAVFQHRFSFDLPGISYAADDNFFDLYPEEPKTIRLRLDRPASERAIRRALTCRSLADTY